MIEDLENEIWVPIFRKYQISNMGRVISNKRAVPILLKTYRQNRDYHLVHFRINGGRKACTIHRLVGLIFVKNTDPLKTTVNHDVSKDDNRAESLSWMTQTENTRHGFATGLIPRGAQHHKTTLDELQVKTIKSLRGVLPPRYLAKYFKVKASGIGAIWRGVSWGHVTV